MTLPLGIRHALPFVLAIAGCDVFDPSLLDRVDGGDGGIDGGDADAGDGGGGDADSGGCGSRARPERPPGEDTGGMSLVRVLIDPDLDQGTGIWGEQGYDLDGRCSRSPDFDVECAPEPPIDPEDDGQDGIDNAFGHRLLPAMLVLGLDPAMVRARIASGDGVILIQVGGYNGEQDDPRVRAVVTQSAMGHAAGAGDPVPTEPPVDAEPPTFDSAGTDYFYPRDDGFLGGSPDTPRFADDGAFVIGGVLVIHVPDRHRLVLEQPDRSLVLGLTDAILTVPLEGGSPATLAGRWPIEDALEANAWLGFCRGTLPYDRVQVLLDQRADLREVPGTGGPGVSCDAISVGIDFQVRKGRIAGIVPTPPLPTTCD